ncbi:MAG: 6-carboxytetrahydropterin synthase, partial [Promethearchaeota archaeon]
VFPRSDVCFLPLAATTSELLAKYIYDKLKEIYRDKKIVVKVGESKSSMASYEE